MYLYTIKAPNPSLVFFNVEEDHVFKITSGCEPFSYLAPFVD
jgi:hypothetical protein